MNFQMFRKVLGYGGTVGRVVSIRARVIALECGHKFYAPPLEDALTSYFGVW